MQTYSNKTMKTSKKPLIANITQVSVKFDRLIALDHISFDVYQNDFIYIVGPNGAGKSTLIKVLTKLIKPSTGTFELYTENIGFLPQNLQVKPNFPITVSEVIYTGFKKQHLFITKEQKKLMKQWLDKMNIVHLENQMMSTLSGGEAQRVFLIRALINNPDLIILDEPTSALDPSFRTVFDDLLNELHKQGKTILLITHDLNHVLHDDRLVLHIDQKLVSFTHVKDYVGGHHHV